MATRNFLITGAGRGIGRGLSRQLLSKGHRVLLVDNNTVELENTSHLLSKEGRTDGKDYMTLNTNLRDSGDIRSAARKAEELFNGRLDCLINNAACV